MAVSVAVAPYPPVRSVVSASTGASTSNRSSSKPISEGTEQLKRRADNNVVSQNKPASKYPLANPDRDISALGSDSIKVTPSLRSWANALGVSAAVIEGLKAQVLEQLKNADILGRRIMSVAVKAQIKSIALDLSMDRHDVVCDRTLVAPFEAVVIEMARLLNSEKNYIEKTRVKGEAKDPSESELQSEEPNDFKKPNGVKEEATPKKPKKAVAWPTSNGVPLFLRDEDSSDESQMETTDVRDRAKGQSIVKGSPRATDKSVQVLVPQLVPSKPIVVPSETSDSSETGDDDDDTDTSAADKSGRAVQLPDNDANICRDKLPPGLQFVKIRGQPGADSARGDRMSLDAANKRFTNVLKDVLKKNSMTDEQASRDTHRDKSMSVKEKVDGSDDGALIHAEQDGNEKAAYQASKATQSSDNSRKGTGVLNPTASVDEPAAANPAATNDAAVNAAAAERNNADIADDAPSTSTKTCQVPKPALETPIATPAPPATSRQATRFPFNPNLTTMNIYHKNRTGPLTLYMEKALAPNNSLDIETCFGVQLEELFHHLRERQPHDIPLDTTSALLHCKIEGEHYYLCDNTSFEITCRFQVEEALRRNPNKAPRLKFELTTPAAAARRSEPSASLGQSLFSTPKASSRSPNKRRKMPRSDEDDEDEDEDGGSGMARNNKKSTKRPKVKSGNDW